MSDGKTWFLGSFEHLGKPVLPIPFRLVQYGKITAHSFGERRGGWLVNDRIEVQVNGERREVQQGWTIDDLVDDLGLRRDQVAVELNRKILKRIDWENCSLNEGDQIEIVHFVGGGEV